eukprot:gnl/MRDRNA2_/MRDRNA2_86249_c0_seq1.p1 gnl/MRDRNA2_/MRDRNA2_86249_c0~~gnl/MRDRNA2_/MRDRNA2_86249_c0_seq1.p1  ORF type:complete len:858 (-),score=160.10 gnl/MRDRNA2_/MRDRNA2_86249_c0_seq1:91-2664(-)
MAGYSVGVIIFRALATLMFWTVPAISQESGTSLQRAFNAALIRIMVNGEWQRIKVRYNKTFGAAWTCSLDSSKYQFPSYTDLHEWETLKQVLDRGSLKVLGFDADWNTDGNYKVTPATGFWPELMDAAVAEMNAFYSLEGKPFVIERVLLSTTAELLHALNEGGRAAARHQGDMTEPYFFVSSLYSDPQGHSQYRHEAFHTSCTLGAGEHMGFTKRGSGITSQDLLNEYADKQPGTTKVGVLTKGNWGQYQPVLSDKIQGSFVSQLRYSSSDFELLDSSLSDGLEALTAFELAGTTVQPGWTLVSLTQEDGKLLQLQSKSDLVAHNFELKERKASATLTFDHYSDTTHLVDAVAGGFVKAGVVSALRTLESDERLDVFPIALMSPQAALFRRETPAEMCPRTGFTNQSEPMSSTSQPVIGSVQRAFNAGLIRMMANGEWQRIITKYGKLFSASWTCSLDTTQYDFPAYLYLKESDALKEVLDTGKLKVLGFDSDWGSDGNYKVTPATGFWPEMMDAAVAEINKFYSSNAGKQVRIERVLLSSTSDILNALQRGKAAPEERQGDMTEPYFFVSSFFDDSDGKAKFRHEKFGVSCMVGSGEHMGLSKKGNGITSQDALNAYAENQEGTTKVGVLTKGNWQQYKPILSKKIQGTYESDITISSSEDTTSVLANLDSNLEVTTAFTLSGVNALPGWTLVSATVGDVKSELTDKAGARLVKQGVFTFKHYVDTAHLVDAVVAEYATAGIVSAMKSLQQDSRVDVFGISLTSPQAALFRRDQVDDICPLHGFHKPITMTTPKSTMATDGEADPSPSPADSAPSPAPTGTTTSKAPQAVDVNAAQQFEVHTILGASLASTILLL